MVFGVNVFGEPPEKLIALLKEANGGSCAIYGSSFGFRKLGIALNDWLEEDASDKWIAAMSAEDYDDFSLEEPDEIVN